MNQDTNTHGSEQDNLHYLRMLAKQYPTVQAASTEIINLQAILILPKGTEHFISDVHGEYEAFQHILNSASGVVFLSLRQTLRFLKRISQTIIQNGLKKKALNILRNLKT